MFNDRAPRPPRFIGHSTWMSRTRFEPEASRDSHAHDRSLARPLVWIGGIDQVEVTIALGGAKLGHQAPIDAMSVGDYAARGCLTKHLDQAHDGYGIRVDNVGEHLSWPHGRQLIHIPDKQQGGPVRYRA